MKLMVGSKNGHQMPRWIRKCMGMEWSTGERENSSSGIGILLLYFASLHYEYSVRKRNYLEYNHGTWMIWITILHNTRYESRKNLKINDSIALDVYIFTRHKVLETVRKMLGFQKYFAICLSNGTPRLRFPSLLEKKGNIGTIKRIQLIKHSNMCRLPFHNFVPAQKGCRFHT